MTNSIQAIRLVYDIAKNARELNNSFSPKAIDELLKATVYDDNLKKQYIRFEKGYAAEDLFVYIYSLLPWVKLIIPLGQEQYPVTSKEQYQVPDYEVMFECSSTKKLKHCLIEVKLVDGDKITHEIKKYQYDVLQEYANAKNEPLLFALFWRKKALWTVNPIDVFSQKSSCYKIDIQTAVENDISAIFGDYSYVFSSECYRKSIYCMDSTAKSEYWHQHSDYGKTMYDGVSVDGCSYKKLSCIESPVLDIAFDFKALYHIKLSDDKIELYEKISHIPHHCKLSSLIISYLYKIYCYDNTNMFIKENDVVRNAFNIVDTVRQKIGGKKYYLIPQKVNAITSQLMNQQFGECKWIIDCYKPANDYHGNIILAPHDTY